jgi:hypothetical protein
MSRRTAPPALEFGSDSFLDVVCNIVGILIILIVVVAVKVERQPLPVADAGAVPVAPAAPDLSPQIGSAQRERGELDATLSGLQESLTGLASRERDLAAERTRLLTDLELQRQKLEQAATRAEQADRTEAELRSETEVVRGRVATLQQELDERDRAALQTGLQVAAVSRSEEQSADELRTTLIETRQLQQVLEQAEAAAVPSSRLQHRLSPVTRPVDAGERHFRVAAGRVSEVPVEELLQRLKAQVLSRRSTVMRFNQFEGLVGPVGGYSMKYTVEKEGATTLDALMQGDGRTKISVSRWTIVPDPELADEPIAEAVRPGSRFRMAIETVPPDSVITLWIYPDSFAGFSELREVAHGLDLRIAARPLPEGTPIVGSPNGSRSNAQ